MKKLFTIALIFLIPLLLIVAGGEAIAQQNVGIGTTTPDPSARLDVVSPNQGVLLPRVNLTSITDVITVPSPVVSLLVYNTNAAITGGTGKGFYYWNGTQWIQAIGPAGTVGATGPTGAVSNTVDTLLSHYSQIDTLLSSFASFDSLFVNGVSIQHLVDSMINAAGTIGATGITGATGFTGATGANGTNGTIGSTGATGTNGTIGSTGATGTNGTIGSTGATGTNGTIGSTGATGTNGTIGSIGSTGATGTNGTIGSTGATGTNGTIGSTGAAGTNGSTGATGSTGSSGTTLLPGMGNNKHIVIISGGNIEYKNTVPDSTGVVLKTPDGTKCYKLRVDNSGNITTQLVPCAP